jgi:O-antigen ligase
MTRAHAIALALIPFLAVAGAVAATWFRRIRDLFFFLMVSLAVLAERTDVNFFSKGWYRGTTRGVQVTLLEILAFGLLIGCWIGRRGEKRLWFWPASLGLMLVYTAYAAASVLAFEPRIFGVFELSNMAAGLIVFLSAAVYVRGRREWTLLLTALGCAVGFEGLWAVKQHLFTQLDRVVGTLDHANSLSMYLCLAVPPLVAAAFAGWSRALRWFCAVASALGTVGLLMTVSRAGIPVFAAVVLGAALACASWRLNARRLVVRAVMLVCVAALVAGAWTQVAKRYAEATLEEEYLDPTVDGRGIYLRLAGMIASDHFFGIGLNNWSYQVSRTYGARLGYRFVDYDYLVATYGTDDAVLYADSYLAAPAHNLAALTLGELGVPGLILFGLLWLRWFGMGAAFIPLPRSEPMRVMGVGLFFGVCGIFGQSLTEWVYRQTPIFLTFAIMLGALASLTADRRRIRIQKPALPGGVAARHEALFAEGV